MTKAEPIRIFLVDDHPLVRAALEQLLAGHGHAVSGQAGSPAEVLAHPALTRSHLVVVDLALDKENGMSLIPALRARRTPVLVYSMHESAHIIRQALAAGALGYVTKREAADSLLAAIHAVRQGETYFLSSTPLKWKVITPWDTGRVFLNFAVLGVPRLC